MMVNRIIAHSNIGTVQRQWLLIRCLGIVKIETYLPMNAALLTVIWDERQFVGCGKLIIGKVQIGKPQFMLHEVQETHREVFGLSQLLRALLAVGLYYIKVKVISLNRPVNHILIIW